MSRLLRAEFSRMLKNKLLWISIALCASETLFELVTKFRLFGFATIMIPALGTAVTVYFTSGSRDLTVNAVISGHSKLSAYFSGLIVCVTAETVMFVILLHDFLHFKNYPLTEIIARLLTCRAALTSITALVFLIMNIIPKKTAAAAVITAIISALFFVNDRLRFYVQGLENLGRYSEAAMICVIRDLTLFGQVDRSMSVARTLPEVYAVVSVAGLLLIATVGAVIFNKKDIK